VAGGLTVIEPPDTSQVWGVPGWVDGWTLKTTFQVPAGTVNVREYTAPVGRLPDWRFSPREKLLGPLR
jgi:hypothetical protein